jgi:predicted transcriptional regulator
VSSGSFRRPFQEPLVSISVKLPPDLVRWLDEQARARKVTRTKLMHDHLRAQQRIHEQLAASFTLGEADGEGTGKQILHAALARHTETVARSIDHVTDAVEEQKKMFTIFVSKVLEPKRFGEWEHAVKNGGKR